MESAELCIQEKTSPVSIWHLRFGVKPALQRTGRFRAGCRRKIAPRSSVISTTYIGTDLREPMADVVQ